MKKTLTGLFIALVTIVGIPNLAVANPANAANPAVQRGSYRLSANSYHTHRIFLGQGKAAIAISGDGDTDLDLYVYDDNGRLIASRTGNTDDEFASLSIYRSSYFTVKVVNRGNVYNDYVLVTS